ncbi:TPA: hypothetical protein PPE37_000410 [Escherichia coli]|nr:hypothetical protein [Escherichia coli]
MTQMSRERLEQYAFDDRMCNVNDEIREMARRLLAAEAQKPLVKHQITASMAKDIAIRLGAELSDDEADIFADGYNAAPQPVAVPDGLRLALSNAGIAAPESDEMLFATHEKYVQLLVDWVKERKPFLPVAVPVVDLPSEFYSSEGVVVQLEKVMAALAVCGVKYKRKGNACRAAMLNAEPVSQPYTLPDDTKRLDWLDAQNKRLNEYYGTSYGWKFDANFQRNAMMLNDSNYPVMNVRQAIDEAMRAAPQEPTK